MKGKFVSKDILSQFKTIMAKEIQIRPHHRHKRHLLLFDDDCGDVMACAEDIYNDVWRIFEITRSSFVSRSYNMSYNLCDGDVVYESVGAHTNMVAAIATAALDFRYGSEFGNKKDRSKTSDGYSYREVMEAVRLHDLPENVMGDLPDNGSRDEAEKRFQEARYLKNFLDTYPETVQTLRKNALRLLGSMEMQDSPTGRLIYLSDKVAALLVTLCLDYLDKPPMILEDSPYVSEKDRQEMELCEDSCGHAYKASEMWAIDFFVIRDLARFDEDFFFTALIVMSTLIINGRWYSWREESYKN